MIVTPEITALLEKQLQEAKKELSVVTAWLKLETSPKRAMFPKQIKRRKELEDLVIVLEASIGDPG